MSVLRLLYMFRSHTPVPNPGFALEKNGSRIQVTSLKFTVFFLTNRIFKHLSDFFAYFYAKP